MKIKLKKTLILGITSLSSLAIAVPTLLTSCSNKPKYVISLSTQIYDNINPYIPNNPSEYYGTTPKQALELWMNNLSDKQKTLDIFSLPFALLENKIDQYYPIAASQSLLSIDVYKSQFKLAKDVKIKNMSAEDDSSFTSDLITWSLNLKINVNPAFPLTVLNDLDFFKDQDIVLPDWNIGSLTLKVDNFPLVFSFQENDTFNGALSLDTQKELGFAHLNVCNSYDWAWTRLRDVFMFYDGDPIGCSVTDAVKTSDVSIDIHVIGPFDKTIELTVPSYLLYYLCADYSWGDEISFASYYLSNLSIEPISPDPKS